jgi:curved DNA-binding protein CbpA
LKNRRNYYRILHVQPDAPVEIIKASYRTMMQKLAQHPDLGGDHWNSTLINEAKEVLTDPLKRIEYDKELMAFHSMSELSGRKQNKQQREKTGVNRSSSKKYDPIIKSFCSFCKSPRTGNSHLLPDTVCTQCKSPLYPVEKVKTDISSQRAVDRIEKHQEISFYTYWPPQKTHKGQIRDLSPNGMQFITDQQLSKDLIIKIDSSVLQATARVANSRKHEADLQMVYYGIGVEFVTIHFKESHGTFVSVTA